MKYDLHSHSTASDGSWRPEELVKLACRQQVDVLALTDHDTTAGLEEAKQASEKHGLRLIPGVEISVTWKKRTVHIVGLNIDPAYQPLQQGLKELRSFREWRAVEIGRKLEKVGIENAFEGASAYAKGSLITRTHFAHYLVEKGLAKDMRDVFKHYLVMNKPGHVSGAWAGLDQAIDWIRGAGGQAVIAHPARYRMTSTKLRELLSDFVECGGECLEVVSSSHSRDERHIMAGFANTYNLHASCGSDYHGPENQWVALGKFAEFPEGCRPVWESERWQTPVEFSGSIKDSVA